MTITWFALIMGLVGFLAILLTVHLDMHLHCLSLIQRWLWIRFECFRPPPKLPLRLTHERPRLMRAVACRFNRHVSEQPVSKRQNVVFITTPGSRPSYLGLGGGVRLSSVSGGRDDAST